jgi:hypothetical protein
VRVLSKPESERTAGQQKNWELAGGVGYGMLAGAMIGVPAGVGAVYFRYKDSV